MFALLTGGTQAVKRHPAKMAEIMTRTAHTSQIELRLDEVKQDPCRLLQSPYLEPMARMLLLFEGNG
jgi:hypothetical protein